MFGLFSVRATGQPRLSPPFSLQHPIILPEGDETENTPMEKFEDAIKDTQKMEGLFALYRNEKKGQIYLEVKPEQLEKNFLCVMTLASGIGEGGLFNGMPLSDFLFYFRRVNDNLHFVVRNVNFRARPGDPQERSLDRSFSDSVLSSLPIKSISDRQTLLIDLGSLLIDDRDLSGLTSLLPYFLGAPFTRDLEQSYFGEAKTFPLNVEVESVYGFTGGEDALTYIPTLPDSRAFTLRVHYSFSELPVNNSYRPRIADERLGYFITAYQDLSDNNSREAFKRYINRWHLEKQDPSSPLSPPKEPIVFWIENTVPVEYRDAFRDGILMWNKAFEKAGFTNAVEARQMPDDATWDPADVRYNTIRWSNSYESWFAGIGPSRVNPLTGEILDADILIDGNIVRFIKGEYRNFLEQKPSTSSAAFLAKLSGNQPLCARGMALDAKTLGLQPENGQQIEEPPAQVKAMLSRFVEKQDLCYAMEAPQNFAVGAQALSMLHNVLPSGQEMNDYVHQYLRYLVSHEVGHTLGLRHNFHGSTMLTPEELQNSEITATKGLTSSVMDYVPVNLGAPGMKQGDYFSSVVGPYDQWAIEYGYKEIDAPNLRAEERELEKIAQRAAEPDLAYAPDEDSFDFLDPAANIFDLSSDMLQYSQWQMDNAREMWSRLDRRYPLSGESYSELRWRFDTLYSYYFRNAMNVTLYVAGQSFNRDRAGDPNGRLPFVPISAEKQREALTTLQKYVFDEKAFQFPPELLNKLAPERWTHWGTNPVIFPLDYPIGDRIYLLQRVVLRSLLAYPRLERLRDLELKSGNSDALTMPELFDTLHKGIWKEVLAEEGQPATIPSIRRSLQREHLDILTGMVLRKLPTPEDASTLAWYQLRQLRAEIDKTVKKRGKNMDTSTKAHLQETSDRIGKTLDAQIQSN